MTITKIEQFLEAQAAQIWPEIGAARYPPRVNFRPQLLLDLGDLYSPYCFKLANRLKVSPDRAGAQLMQRLSGLLTLESAVQVTLQRGYINIRLRGQAISLPAELRSSEAGLVVLPAHSSAFCGWVAMRLASRAVLSCFLAQGNGTRVELYIGNERFAVTQEGQGRVWRQILELLLRPSVHAPQTLTIEGLDRLGKQLSCARVQGWGCQGHLAGDFERAYLGEVETEDGLEISIKAPSAAWFDGLDELGDPEQLLQWGDNELLSLLVYAAGDADGRSFDLLIPRVGEAKNINWILAATMLRLVRLLPLDLNLDLDMAAEQPQTSLVAYEDLQRRFGVLDRFLVRAANYGEVGELLTGITYALHRLSQMLNAPEFRLRHAKRQDWEAEKQTMTGALGFLSIIIQRYPFFSKNNIDPVGYE